MVYLIPLSLTVFGAYYFDIKKNKRGERILYNFLFIYLVFLIGFRFEVGGDTALSKTVGDDFVYFQLLHIIITVVCFILYLSLLSIGLALYFFCFIYYYLKFLHEILRIFWQYFVFVSIIRITKRVIGLNIIGGVCIAILFHISKKD